MQNILVPTDFSPAAHHAFEAALQMAQRTGGQVTLLHVLDSLGSGGIPSSGGLPNASGMEGVFMMQLLGRTKQRMRHLLAEAARLAAGVPVQDMIETGAVDEAVLELVRQRGFDLVVVGAREHMPGRPLFTTESLAERLVRLAPCPVLTVKHPAANFTVRHLVFASDFSAEADAAALRLQQLCAAFPDATLHLLDVEPAAEREPAALERMHAFAERNHLRAYEPDVYQAPKVRTAIARYAEEAHADLVVMLTHGHTGLRHLLQGSIAESVAVSTAAPVLTFHPRVTAPLARTAA